MQPGEAEAERDGGDPSRPPFLPRAAHKGLPDKTGQRPSTAPAKRPPGHHLLPVRRGRSQEEGANRLSPRRPTVRQERPSPLWGRRAARHGPASGHPERPRGESGSPSVPRLVTADFAPRFLSPLPLARAPRWTRGPPRAGSHHVFPWGPSATPQAGETDHVAGDWPIRALRFSRHCDWLTYGHVTQIKPIRTKSG